MNYGKLCLRFGFVLTFVLLSLPLAVFAASQMAEEAGAVADQSPDVAEYIRAAKQGGIEEQYKLGEIYRKGEGVAKDEKEAVKWFRRAADQSHAASQWRLGLMYYNGEGVAKDEKEATKWLRRAADQGDADAQASLGAVLINKDDAEAALQWIRRAADQNLARGQFLLGWMYLNGRGVAKDEGEALKWLRASAQQGYEEARKLAAEHFNYDALDDDGPVSYEEHLKAHSLELYTRTRDVVASGDGKRVVLPFAKKGEPENFVGMSLWEYDSARETFVKHPFSFLRKSELPFGVAISPDGALLAYADSKADDIILVDLNTNRTLWVIKHGDFSSYEIAISRDNETLAVYASSLDKDNLAAYSVKQRTQRGQITVPEEFLVNRMFFGAGGNLVVSYSIRDNDHNYDRYVRIYDDKLQSTQIQDYALAGIDPDGDRLFLLTYGDVDIDEKDFKTMVYDLRSRQWAKTDLPFTFGIFFGPAGRFLESSYEEYVLKGDKALFLQDGPDLDIFKRIDPLYVAAAQSWLIFFEDRIIVMKPASETVVRAMTVLEAGCELLQAGFHQPGAAKVKEAMAIYPTADRLNGTLYYAELVEEHVPLRYIGELLLAQYDELLKNATGSQKEKIIKAVERLRDYGLFAASAGHPNLTLAAAQRVRSLQGRYPDAVAWDQLLKNALALEALQIAATQSPDKAYEHILSQGGLIHDDYPAIVHSINHWKIKSYWSLLYSDLNKLAYLLKRDVAKLKKPEALSIPPQAYPDLTGRIVEPGSPAPPVQITPTTPARKSSSPKGRVLD